MLSNHTCSLSEHPSKSHFSCKLVLLVCEVKNHKLDICCRINPQAVSNWSLLFSCRSKNTLNYFAPQLFLGSKHMMYNSIHPIFTTMTKSHTNVSWAYANLISAWINSNNGMMQTSPITTSMSQRYWRLVFTTATICKSSCIFTTIVSYSARTHWARNNMETTQSLHYEAISNPWFQATWQEFHVPNVFQVKMRNMCM